jgi:hypothetical protein
MDIIDLLEQQTAVYMSITSHYNDALFHCVVCFTAMIEMKRLAFDELNRNLTKNFQIKFVKSRKVLKMQLEPWLGILISLCRLLISGSFERVRSKMYIVLTLY